MLVLEVVLKEDYDEEENLFIPVETFELRMEHSLVSLSKWEQKYEKPFMSEEPKTAEEMFYYIECMCLDEKIPGEIFQKLSDKNIMEINDYINAKMTATWFRDDGQKTRNNQIITAEIIYYWMISLQIDMQCERWHLAQLLTLIRVANEKNAPAKKMSQRDNIRERNRLNEQRLAAARR